MLNRVLLHVRVHVECMRPISLAKHVLGNQIVLVMCLSHHVLVVRGGGAESVVVLRVALLYPANFESVLIWLALVVVALVELCTIHLP